MALAALIVAIISACASVGTIAVSVWVHNRQGSRLECRSTWAYPVFDGRMVDDPYVQVDAINHGRSAATVSGWGFVILDARGRPTDESVVSFTHVAWQPALPARVDAESTLSWSMPRADIQASLARAGKGDAQVKGFIDTGTKRRLMTKEPIRLRRNG